MYAMMQVMSNCFLQRLQQSQAVWKCMHDVVLSAHKTLNEVTEWVVYKKQKIILI